MHFAARTAVSSSRSCCCTAATSNWQRRSLVGLAGGFAWHCLSSGSAARTQLDLRSVPCARFHARAGQEREVGISGVKRAYGACCSSPAPSPARRWLWTTSPPEVPSGHICAAVRTCGTAYHPEWPQLALERRQNSGRVVKAVGRLDGIYASSAGGAPLWRAVREWHPRRSLDVLTGIPGTTHQTGIQAHSERWRAPCCQVQQTAINALSRHT